MNSAVETLREAYSPVISDDTLDTLRQASQGEKVAFCIYTESGELLDIQGVEAQGDVLVRITAQKELVEEAIGRNVGYFRLDRDEARHLFIVLSDCEA